MRFQKLLVTLISGCFVLVVGTPVSAEMRPTAVQVFNETALTEEDETADNDTSEEEAKRIISINKESFSIEEFSSDKLVATINLEANTYSVAITSSNPAVATVSSDGVISALTPGTTTITVLVIVNDSTTSYSRTIPVSVYSISGTISFDSSAHSVNRGSSFDINYTLSTEALSKHDIIWTSSNPSVATVVNGRVTGVRIGTTTVTATIGSISTSMTITVIVPLSQIEFNPAVMTLEVGQTTGIPALIYVPYDTTDSKKATYEVEDESIVVISDGSIRALKQGKTFIYAKINNIEAVLEIHVTPQTEAVESQQLPLSILKSTEDTLFLTVSDITQYQGNRFHFVLPVETVKSYMEKNDKMYVVIVCDDYLIRDNWKYFNGMNVDQPIMALIKDSLEFRFVSTSDIEQVSYRFTESYDKSINLRFTVASVTESSAFYSDLTSPGYALRFYNSNGYPAGTRFSINAGLLGNSLNKIHLLYLVEDNQLVDTQQESKVNAENGVVQFSVSDNYYVITFTKIGTNSTSSIIVMLSLILLAIVSFVGSRVYRRFKSNKGMKL